MPKCLENSVTCSKQSYALGGSLNGFIILLLTILWFCMWVCVHAHKIPGTLKDNIFKWITIPKLSSKLQKVFFFMGRVSLLLYYNMNNSEE